MSTHDLAVRMVEALREAQRHAEGHLHCAQCAGLALRTLAACRTILSARDTAYWRWAYYQRDGEEPFVSESRASLEAIDKVLRTLAAIYGVTA